MTRLPSAEAVKVVTPMELPPKFRVLPEALTKAPAPERVETVTVPLLVNPFVAVPTDKVPETDSVPPLVIVPVLVMVMLGMEVVKAPMVSDVPVPTVVVPVTAKAAPVVVVAVPLKSIFPLTVVNTLLVVEVDPLIVKLFTVVTPVMVLADVPESVRL